MFRNALRVVEEAQKTYDEMRAGELSELSRVGIISATLVSEVLAKMKSLISTLSTIESTLESQKPAIIKLCEGLTYVSDNQVTSVIHKTPLTIISYNSEENKISVSNKQLSLSLKERTLEIRFRNHKSSLDILAKEDLEKHANLIKALASEKLELINYAISIVESCRKRIGLR